MCTLRTYCLLGTVLLAGLGPHAARASDTGEGGAAQPGPPERARWNLQAGGQLRLRADLTRHQDLTDFRFAPREHEAQFLQRSRLGVSVGHPAWGPTLFVQGQWYGAWGSVAPHSDIRLYQGYAELAEVLGLPLDLRIGRQEFTYGSTFFLGPNDFYNGLSWDAVKASVRGGEDLLVDGLAGRMAELNPGDPDHYLAGVSATYSVSAVDSLSGYVFFHHGEFPLHGREFEDQAQRNVTVGMRFAGRRGGVDYELEPQVQWGRVRRAIGAGQTDVSASGGHLDVGYTLGLPYAPRIFAAYAYGSGCTSVDGGHCGEFHGNVFNDTYLVGDTSVIADLSGVTVAGVRASGVHVGVVGCSVQAADGLHVALDAHRFLADTTPPGISKDLGIEVNVVTSYQAAPWMSVLLGLNRFYTGRFFAQATGSTRNIDYAYLQTQFEF